MPKHPADRQRYYGDDRRREYDDREPRRGFDDREERRGFDDREPRRGFDDREPRRGFDDREPRRGFDDREDRRGFGGGREDGRGFGGGREDGRGFGGGREDGRGFGGGREDGRGFDDREDRYRRNDRPSGSRGSPADPYDPRPRPDRRNSTPYQRPPSAAHRERDYGSPSGSSRSPTMFQASAGSSRSPSVYQSPAGPSQSPSSLPPEVVAGEVAVPEPRAEADNRPVGQGNMANRRYLPVDIITRPRELTVKTGKIGKPIKLQANYFKLLSTTDWCLYQYRVDFTPAEERTAIRKGLLRQCREHLGAYIFDGTVLYTSSSLPDPLELQAERKADNELMTISIRRVGDMRRGDHHYIQFFNIIMRKCLEYLDLRLVGRNFFDPHNRAEVHEWKLDLWPGYITSIRQHEQDILMCAEITHKVMRDETLLDVLAHCYEEDQGNWRNLFRKQVVGVVVLTDYNNNTYRIDDVDNSVSPKSTFTKKNGETISYYDYYYTKYQIRIQDLRQPLLVSRTKPRERRGGAAELVYLIPELCRSTGLTDAMRNNFRLMSSLARYTRVSPADRIQKLMRFNERLHNVPNVVEELRSWNLTLDRRLVELNGRILPSEKILYSGTTYSDVPHNANWTNDLRNKSLRICGNLEEWAVIVPVKFKRDTQNFVECLTRVASRMNFIIKQPWVYEIESDQANAYAETLEMVKSQKNPMLIMCIAGNNRLDRYKVIKKKCCVDRPVPSQVVLTKSLQSKSQMSIATKVAIQMNCKIGGIPWSVKIPLNSLMVVGFDVCRDTQNRSRDFGAMVASLDVNFGRYFSAVSSHSSGEELSNEFSAHLCKALHQFKNYNQIFPKRIIIYRDGVGDGQVHHVISHEVKMVKDKLAALYGGAEHVKLAFIIVTKKINTRLFFNGGNPVPGTVVDDTITDPSKYDFLIIPQHVGQGTVTPSSYNVIEDTTGLTVDQLQILTYKFCHLYFNWSGTVRVPAPCQYAHKLAFLIAQAVHTAPANLLETLLYFL